MSRAASDGKLVHSRPEGSGSPLVPPPIVPFSEVHRMPSLRLPDWPASNRGELERGRALLSTMEMDPTTFSRDDLCHLVLEIFQSVGLPKELDEDIGRLKRFILAVRASMYDNPYHNWFHVFDVTQTLYVMATRTGLFGRLCPWKRLALLCAGLCHDLEHPGVTSLFLEKAGEHISSAFKDGVLEKHHAIRTFEVMVDREIGLLEGLSTKTYYDFRNAVSGCILATDFGCHKTFSTRLTEFLLPNSPPLPTQLEMELLIKCADISNVLKPFPIARRWALRVTDEFFLQGDVERNYKMEVTAMCDRNITARSGLQRGFYDFVCIPFFLDIVKVFPELETAAKQMNANRAEWEECTDMQLAAHRDWPDEDAGSDACDSDGDAPTLPPQEGAAEAARDGGNSPLARATSSGMAVLLAAQTKGHHLPSGLSTMLHRRFTSTSDFRVLGSQPAS